MNNAFAVPACLLCVSACMCVCMHLFNLINVCVWVCVYSCVKKRGQQMISSVMKMCSLSINISENGVNEQTHQFVSAAEEKTQTNQQPREAPGKETDRKHTQGWEQVRL